ncbi:MAG TPA: NAD(+) diphosphatase [Spirochaetia bacterium]
MSFPDFATFVPRNTAPEGVTGDPVVLVTRGSDLLLVGTDESPDLPLFGDVRGRGLPLDVTHPLGSADGAECVSASVLPTVVAPPGMRFVPVRSLFGRIPDTAFKVIFRALEIGDWDRESRFCGRCGAATLMKDGERARECPSCGALIYPRISPAVIMAVVRDDTILLARAQRFAAGFYSVLAGFVEPGETLEECVAREVREETGIEVKNIRYFASQPWPFPHSLMVAFTAEHATGEIRVDHTELVDAAWYRADALPRIPDRLTVARRLIDWFVASRDGRTA